MIHNNYNEHWLRDIQVHLRAMHHICPDFWIGDDDPDEIIELKKKLHDLKNNIGALNGELHDMIDKKSEEDSNERRIKRRF